MLTTALLREITDARDDRLLLTAEWLQAAASNSSMVAHGVRIGALRTGFETLLGVGDSYKNMGQALHVLVERPTTRRWPRHWTTLRGKPTSDHLTALQWWYYNLCFLRNELAHGDRVKASAWRWKGEHQVVKAERELRRAVRADLVRLGHDSLLVLPHADRERARFDAHVAAVVARHFGRRS